MRSSWIAVVAGAFVVSGFSQSPDGGTKLLDPLVADPAHYHLEFQNQWPGLSDQNIRQTLQDGMNRSIAIWSLRMSWSG
jgi:hypothetical protein